MSETPASPTCDPTFWKKCSTCKNEIAFGTIYYECSVSTCRGARLGLKFCSVACWDAHLGFARHRSATADEMRSPSRSEFTRLQEAEGETMSQGSEQSKKVVVRTSAEGSPMAAAGGGVETLIVVSKVKAFIREKSGFNTSSDCIDALTQVIVRECLNGIENARLDSRKTVMARDIR